MRWNAGSRRSIRTSAAICIAISSRPAQLAAAADVTLPLGGVPIAIKDVLNVRGQPCTCASKILRGYIAPYDATAIARLRAAGAIPFGRTNMDEFAMGSSTENSERPGHGQSLGCHAHPRRLERRLGGGCRGRRGISPRWGRIPAGRSASRRPFAAAWASSRRMGASRGSGWSPSPHRSTRSGHSGKRSATRALLLNAISGQDPQDSTSIAEPVPDFTATLERDLKGVRLGMPREYFIEGIDPQVDAAVRAAIKHYESLGAEIVEVSLPHTDYAVAVYYILATAEASANLARFDGVRYGHRAENPANLLDHYGRTREEGFGPEVKRRIILGTYVLSSGYYDAYYLRAQKVRTLIRRDFTRGL